MVSTYHIEYLSKVLTSVLMKMIVKGGNKCN